MAQVPDSDDEEFGMRTGAAGSQQFPQNPFTPLPTGASISIGVGSSLVVVVLVPRSKESVPKRLLVPHLNCVLSNLRIASLRVG